MLWPTCVESPGFFEGTTFVVKGVKSLVRISQVLLLVGQGRSHL